MSPRIVRLVRLGLLTAGVGFVLLQVFPVSILGVPTQEIGANPPERFPFDGGPEIETILRKACFDCHSNETRWPIYTRIAPASWLMARDIHKARTHLNFSKWRDADEDERQGDRENCWDKIQSGEMPPWFYIFPFHRDARLTDAEKSALRSYFLKNKKTDGEGDHAAK